MVTQDDGGLMKKLEDDLSAPVCVCHSGFFVKNLSHGLHLTRSSSRGPGHLYVVQRLQLSYSLMSGSVTGRSRLSLCLIHGCLS